MDDFEQTVFVSLALAAPLLVAIRRWLNPKRESRLRPAVEEIWLFPIKSCAGLKVKQAAIDQYGLQHDRRFMVVSKDKKRFQSQRALPIMANIHVGFVGDDLVAVHEGMPPLYLATCADVRRNAIGDVQVKCDPSTVVGKPTGSSSSSSSTVDVTIWDDTIAAQTVSDEHDRWFSQALGKDVQLVRTLPPNQHHRLVNNNITRFRPNVVVAACVPFEEDTWQEITVGDNITMDLPEPCMRCSLPTVDPDTGKKDPKKEPTKTLQTYRSNGHGVFFGQNAVVQQTTGSIRVGDRISVLKRKDDDPIAQLY
ncbi:hypothetical protein PTSG_06464 [Salpingoeca rosetta]|uniref:MOSC domain-containing protein n=1 Tax=Salpingoeca rosetta (strain ATCC 50818 / BSB-021) TaxID=946362 RepID=F2UFV9_SALR5|nr:uncharacterized protein PTSG_06464 [Salpingoeca rosetta]EGD75387.1 hypothetical protein PTSG_06464 [Salpingoeca rosetta]|eukprot:XP_004991844.1 hypothetical protein PTSG_06464 [Salpingoeca rosetta]